MLLDPCSHCGRMTTHLERLTGYGAGLDYLLLRTAVLTSALRRYDGFCDHKVLNRPVGPGKCHEKGVSGLS